MLFVISAVNDPEASARRAHARAAHLTFLREALSVIRFGGAVKDLDGRPIGPLLIVDLPDAAAAQAFAQADPYQRIGGYQSVTIGEVAPRIPEPRPGYLDEQIAAERVAREQSRPFVRQSGEGTPLVLLHGFGLDGTCWDEVAEQLRDGIRVIRPDLRGLGRSSSLPGPYTIERQADDVIDLLDEFALPRAVLVGHSMGGVVATEVARRYPERVAGLALIDSRVDRDTAEQERSRLELAARAEREGNAVIAVAYLPKFFAPAVYTSRPELPARAAAMMRQAEGTAAAVFAGSVRRFDGDAVLAALAVPVLVVTGSEDAFFTVASQRRIADAAQRGDLVVLDGVGHMSLWEAPAALARLLEDLIDRV